MHLWSCWKGRLSLGSLLWTKPKSQQQLSHGSDAVKNFGFFIGLAVHIAHWLCIISIICDVGCVLTSPCTICELMPMVSQMVTFAVADQLPPDGRYTSGFVRTEGSDGYL